MSHITCYGYEKGIERADGERRVSVELRIDTDATTGKLAGASVKYGASNPWIPLAFAHESINSKDRKLTTTWTEIIAIKPHGRYVVHTFMGASVFMSYTNYRTGKRYEFISTGDESGTAYDSKDPCDWD